MSSEETELIADIVASVGPLWDQGKFELARLHFADVVEIDYRSLGAPAVTQDPVDQLEQNWRAVLPGFDKTDHHIDTVRVEIDGLKATTRASIIAYHYIKGAAEGESWTLVGTYNHVLEKRDGTWKITKMTLNVEHQFGNLKLLVQAATKVALSKAI